MNNGLMAASTSDPQKIQADSARKRFQNPSLAMIELTQDGPDGHHFTELLLEKGAIIKDTHHWVLRFTPPIVASKEDLEFALGCKWRK